MVYQQLYGRTETIQATALTDGYYENGQYSFDIGSVTLASEDGRQLPGKGKAGTQGLNAVFQGDVVELHGRMYATRGSRQFGMSYAQGTVVGHQTSFLQRIRQRFTSGVHSTVPEPLGSFGLGLLIGQRTDLPELISDDLSRAGLTHIVAVSGYNLTIIIQIIRSRLQRGSKYQTTVLSASLIICFVLVTGFSASIVRASIVSLLSLWAWYYGRVVRPLVLVFLPAALTALWNPFYLWSDVGWYLSFLAFFGVLTLAPLWQQRPGQQNGRITVVGQLVRESLAAQLMTMPIIMYIFGRVSFVGLIANLVVVPLVPLAMLLTFVAGVVGMFVSQIGGWMGLPATVLLNYMLDITHLLASVAHASIDYRLSLSDMLLLYGCVLVYVSLLWRKVHRHAKITDETDG
ncbi:ComEC/Rec2 family competence protein [Candidatus Saccharibacteria bacterium]|nr:ComEC/Rec2 family competence protein [Candidatus Saccharibacteria bacterium]